MRNKYTNEFENKMKLLAPTHTLSDLLEIAQKDYIITKSQLQKYLSKRNIKYKDYNANKVRNVDERVLIGTERIKPDGMIQVKVSKNKWVYKQRMIYENYYNVKLTSDDYIIFLDQDRTNFDITNLKRISRRESSILANQKMFSKDKNLTELGILTAKLMIKSKEKGEMTYE